MKTRRALLGGLLLLVGIGMLVSLHRTDEGDFVAAQTTHVQPHYTLLDAEWTRFDADGNPSLEGESEKIVYFDDQSGHATNLVVDALGVGGAPWKISSPNAVLPARERRFELVGPVDMAGRWPDTGEPLRMRTDRVWIDPDKHELSNNVPIEIDSAKRSGTAVGMQANWLNRSLQLLHDVQMTYKTPAR